jgi:hypothetical protein
MNIKVIKNMKEHIGVFPLKYKPPYLTTDNGTTITGITSIQLTGANSNLSGSFSGSFRGDGTNLTGVTATPSFPTSTITSLESAYKFFVNDDTVGNNTSNNRQITYANLLTDLAGSNLVVVDSDSLALSTTITSITSITSTSFTGSLLGTAATASYVNGNIYNSSNPATSASYAATASYVPTIKSGAVAAGSFSSTGGENYKATVAFTVAYANTSYSISIVGGDARSWTIESKGAGQFTINSNSLTPLTAEVYWVTIPYNN